MNKYLLHWITDVHSFSPPWSGSTGMINDLLQQPVLSQHMLFLWKMWAKSSFDTDLPSPHTLKLPLLMSNFIFIYFPLSNCPNFFFTPSFCHQSFHIFPLFNLIFHSSQWTESYYYPHSPSQIHMSLINELIFPIIPGWIGSSLQSLGDKSQKAPTSSSSLPGAILLTTPQRHALLVNADGLTFMWIL